MNLIQPKVLLTFVTVWQTVDEMTLCMTLQHWGPGLVAANKYKVILMDYLYSMMKHFYPEASDVFQDESAYTGQEGH